MRKIEDLLRALVLGIRHADGATIRTFAHEFNRSSTIVCQNGGTEKCKIVTVEDNILKYHDRLAYRFCRRFFEV